VPGRAGGRSGGRDSGGLARLTYRLPDRGARALPDEAGDDGTEAAEETALEGRIVPFIRTLRICHEGCSPTRAPVYQRSLAVTGSAPLASLHPRARGAQAALQATRSCSVSLAPSPTAHLDGRQAHLNRQVAHDSIVRILLVSGLGPTCAMYTEREMIAQTNQVSRKRFLLIFHVNFTGHRYCTTHTTTSS
jgi:hypothetical protein